MHCSASTLGKLGALDSLSLGNPSSLGRSSAHPHLLLSDRLSEMNWFLWYQHRESLCSNSHLTHHPKQTNWHPVLRFTCIQIFQPCSFTANTLLAAICGEKLQRERGNKRIWHCQCNVFSSPVIHRELPCLRQEHSTRSTVESCSCQTPVLLLSLCCFSAIWF